MTKAKTTDKVEAPLPQRKPKVEVKKTPEQVKKEVEEAVTKASAPQLEQPKEEVVELEDVTAEELADALKVMEKHKAAQAQRPDVYVVAQEVVSENKGMAKLVNQSAQGPFYRLSLVNKVLERVEGTLATKEEVESAVDLVVTELDDFYKALHARQDAPLTRRPGVESKKGDETVY